MMVNLLKINVSVINTSKKKPKYIFIVFVTLQSYGIIVSRLITFVDTSHLHIVRCDSCRASYVFDTFPPFSPCDLCGACRLCHC